MATGCDNPTYIRYQPPKWDHLQKNWMYGFGADCGKCMPCLKKRKAQWAFRLGEEKKDAFSSYFVTLTYNEEKVPRTDTGYTTNKEDHKYFIKWLKYYENPKRLKKRDLISLEELQRKAVGIKEDKKLKYYGITEYGDLEGRSHLHYIVFNVIDRNNINMAWSEQVQVRKRQYAPGNSYGRVDVDECNQNTIDYVLKYMLKIKPDGQDQIKEPELSFMSKGLGSGYINDETLRYISKPSGNAVVNQRGTKTSLPRYYSKRYLSEEDRNRKAIYIRNEVERKQKERENRLIREGKNPDQVDAQGKAARYETLSNRKQLRDVKNEKRNRQAGIG